MKLFIHNSEGNIFKGMYRISIPNNSSIKEFYYECKRNLGMKRRGVS